MSTLRRLRKQGSTDSSNKFRVAVFGQAGVGKTAFTVRFVTKRFIGEYDPSLESIYQRTLTVPPNHSVFFEIMDTPGQEENSDILKEKIKWADGYVLLYSITDKVSFSEIAQRKFLISHTTTNGSQKGNGKPMIAVVGNKKDLDVERMVTTEEGRDLADSLNCYFHEISVRESSDEVAKVFENLYRAWRKPEKGSLKRSKSGGQGPQFETAIIHHHFPTLHSRRKHKSYKHINRMPRMNGSIGVCRKVLSQTCDSSLADNGDVTVGLRLQGTSSLCSSPIAKSRFLHIDSTSPGVQTMLKRRSIRDTGYDSDGECHYTDVHCQDNCPRDVARGSGSDTCDECTGDECTTSSDNSSPDSCTEEGYDSEGAILFARKAAEDFARKIMLLSLE